MDVEKTIREYLPQIVHMSLGTCRDNKPWVCEVHFVYDDNLNIYFRSRASRRHSQDIAANPQVAGNIVTQHFLNQPGVRGVYFEGTAKQLVYDEAKLAFPYFQKRLNVPQERLEEAKNPEGHLVYKISVSTFYVFDSYAPPSDKYELKWHSNGA